MKIYLEYQDEKSHKFWQLERNENSFSVIYGKIGSKGLSSVKEFDSAEKAEKEANKLIKQKLKKGYVESTSAYVESESDKIEDKADEFESDLKIISDYEKAFGKYDVPLTLKKLAIFEEEAGCGNTFNCNFDLMVDEDAFGTYLDEEELSKKEITEYKQSLLPFATTDGTGGIVAFWIKKGNVDLEKAPIISFGSEGYIGVVAQDLKEFIRLLSFGAECMDASFYHFFSEYDEDSDFQDFESEFLNYQPNFLKFRTWMKEELNIKPIKVWGEEDSEEVNKIIQRAQKKVSKAFDKWQYKFYPDPEDEAEIYRKAELEKIIKKEQILIKKLEAEPENANFYFEYAKLEVDKGRQSRYNHEKIDSFYLKTIEKDPNHLDALKALAKKDRLRDYEKALQYYFKILEINEEENKNLYSDVAYCYKKLKNNDKAIEFYTKDIISTPSSYGGYSQEYIIEICKEIKQDAITTLENIANEVDCEHTNKELIKLYIKAKKYDKAFENYEKFVKLSKGLQDFEYMDYAEKFFKKEVYDVAFKMYEFGLKKMSWDDKKADCYNYMGICKLKHTRDVKEAIPYYEKAVKLDPDEKIYQDNLNYCKNEINKK